MIDFAAIAKLPGWEERPGVADAALVNGGNCDGNVLAPLNVVGDKSSEAGLMGNTPTTPKGFREAYNQFAGAGWIGLPLPLEYGGQGFASRSYLDRHSRCGMPSNLGFCQCVRCLIKAQSK